MRFDELGLPEALIRALSTAGYTEPTPVQAQAIPPALEGRDLRVSSPTGSGKTASFMLPALKAVIEARATRQASGERRPRGVAQGPSVLVLTPTRELAMQVAKAASDYGRFVPGLRVATVVGGVPYGAQLRALQGPLDILIATPGRLIDHLGAGKAVLSNLRTLVLDEADRMLDMGFIEDIHHIAAATPAERQTLMYSATFAGHVGALAQELLRDPMRVDVAGHTEAHADIEQRLHWADDLQHKNALLDHLLTERELEQAVVFTSTQRDADWLAERLAEMGHSVAALHGGMPQGRRNRVLQGLRQRQLRVLVATDVAARGIDVPTISHVINYGLPMKAEDYVHRIGRTGRAGRSGVAVTLAERRDAGMVQRIQRFTTHRIPPTTITGLEPRRPEPQMEARRALGPGGPRREGFGGPRREGFGGPRREGFGAPRREGFGGPRQDGFGGPRHEGFGGPRHEGAGPDAHRPARSGFGPKGPHAARSHDGPAGAPHGKPAHVKGRGPVGAPRSGGFKRP
jgi:superfamily II DNA/RNA helicase